MQPIAQAKSSIRPRRSRQLTFAAALLLAIPLGGATAVAQDTKLVGKSGDWSLFAHPGDSPICFLTSQSRETEPKGQRRSSHFYITSWVKDGVKQEISLNLGTTLKPNSAIDLAIGATKFKLFAQGDKAFLTNAADEAKLVAAMKKGNFMVVEATAAGGASLKDKYSLIGISQGVASLAKGCN